MLGKIEQLIPDTCDFCDDYAEYLIMYKKINFFLPNRSGWQFVCRKHFKKWCKNLFEIKDGQIIFYENEIG